MCSIKKIQVQQNEGSYWTTMQMTNNRSFIYVDEVRLAEEEAAHLVSMEEVLRHAFLAYLATTSWQDACDVLEEFPVQATPWAIPLLRTTLAQARLSRQDITTLRDHLIILELARAEGVEAVRALLRRVGNKQTA